MMNAYEEVYQSTRFQSLLSQGISLLSEAFKEDLFKACIGFNPFLVRASVY